MKISTQISTALMVTFFAFQANALDNVAKVIVMRGMVKAKLIDGTIIDVKTDQSIPEGAVVQTADKSFVKLLFIDKSQMNLGPNSQMIINAFPKKEAGIITLVKGQIRSQVTKDYMEMDDKNKSKLYIKTKTAAMGIRGTDFQVNYNPENKNTSLVTFEGKVAMAHIAKDLRDNSFNQNQLENFVSGKAAVMVTQGHVSAVNHNLSERAMVPTKMGVLQIEALEKNETGLNGPSTGIDSSKQFRSPIPPGTDGSIFSNNSLISDDLKNKSNEASGYFDLESGDYKLPAGSILDLKTLNIIPPPANSVFDANTGTYIVPETLGKIDKSTGEYKAPAGLELGSDGKFNIVDPETYEKAQPAKPEADKESDKNGDQRSPASVPPPPPATAPDLFHGGARDFMNTFAPDGRPLGPPPIDRENLAGLAREIIENNDVAKQTANDLGTSTPKTKVKFIINAN